MNFNIKKLSKEIHFPTMKPIHDPPKKKKWWQRWFQFVKYRRKFTVTKNYLLWVPKLGTFLFIPAKFIFDGASVPKILNGIFNPTGMLLLGAGPHDFLYRYEGLLLLDKNGEVYFKRYSKKEGDDIFQHLCEIESGFVVASKTASGLLGMVGFIGWNENRKKDCVLTDDFPGVFV